MDSGKIKKALRMAVNVGCGFEGDAEDAKGILGLITDLEAKVAKSDKLVRDLSGIKRG